MVYPSGREAADAVFDRIGAVLPDTDKDPVAEGLERALGPVALPPVVIKAYGAPDPRQGQKADMFVRQLPSALLAEANRDARRLARQGYFPVAMAWYDAGSEGAGLVAFNSGVKELHLVLTITYRLDAGS
jgi:hypothetical protein